MAPSTGISSIVRSTRRPPRVVYRSLMACSSCEEHPSIQATVERQRSRLAKAAPRCRGSRARCTRRSSPRRGGWRRAGRCRGCRPRRRCRRSGRRGGECGPPPSRASTGGDPGDSGSRAAGNGPSAGAAGCRRSCRARSGCGGRPRRASCPIRRARRPRGSSRPARRGGRRRASGRTCARRRTTARRPPTRGGRRRRPEKPPRARVAAGCSCGDAPRSPRARSPPARAPPRPSPLRAPPMASGRNCRQNPREVQGRRARGLQCAGGCGSRATMPEPRPLGAIVLAAGLGTRMRSAEAKVLHRLGGRPLIAWPLAALRELGVARTVVVVGHQAEAVRAAAAAALAGVETVHQAEQRGTGDAVHCAAGAFAGFDGDVLVLYGDVPLVRAATLRALVDAHRAAGATLSLLTADFEDPSGYGRIVRDAAGRVTGIVEERDASPEERRITEINPGFYCVAAAELASLLSENAQGEYYLTDLVALAARAGRRIVTVPVEQPWEVAGINTRTELARME